MTDNRIDAVVIERLVQAPASLVWRMWTEPEHFAAWYGPEGSSVPVATMDVRVGGERRICMELVRSDAVMQMWFVGEYREVVPGRRLVYTEAMADADGRVLSPAQLGMPGDHPVTTEVILDFEDLGARTRLTLTHVGIPAGSPGAQGWTAALDALELHLTRIAA